MLIISYLYTSGIEPEMVESMLYLKAVIKSAIIYVLVALIVTSCLLKKNGNKNIEKYILFFSSICVMLMDFAAKEFTIEIAILLVWNLVMLLPKMPNSLSFFLKCIGSLYLLYQLLSHSIVEYSLISVLTLIIMTALKVVSCIWLLLLFYYYYSASEIQYSYFVNINRLSKVYLLCLICSIGFGGTMYFTTENNTKFLDIAILTTIAAVLATLAYLIFKKPFTNKLEFKLNLRLKMTLIAFSTIMIIFIPVSISTIPYGLNEPIYWHKMGSEAHLTLRINPINKRPDVQKVRLDLWLPVDVGKPEQVVLNLNYTNETVIPKLQETTNQLRDYEFDGFVKYSYIAEDRYFNTKGKVVAAILFEDYVGNQYYYEKEVAP